MIIPEFLKLTKSGFSVLTCDIFVNLTKFYVKLIIISFLMKYVFYSFLLFLIALQVFKRLGVISHEILL